MISIASSLVVSGPGAVASAQHQPTADLPFAPGERKTFAGRVHVGVGGAGTIWVEGPVEIRGQSTWVLHSDMEGKLGPIRATVRNASWLDPAFMASLRYSASERHLWKKHDDVVEIFPGERARAAGTS